MVSFAIDGVTVNLIDTPGHPDFIAEVERVLSVLDGAVLVISAVEGVQPQTRVLMRALRRLRIPALLFVNKIDRPGAGEERVLRAIAARLSPAIAPMGFTSGLGTRAADFTLWGEADAAGRARLAEILAERDERILAAYVDNELGVPYARLRGELAAQARRALVYPVFFGSAVTGAGVPPLMAGLTELLPAAAGDAAGPVSGRVFKIERGPRGEKLAYVTYVLGHGARPRPAAFPRRPGRRRPGRRRPGRRRPGRRRPGRRRPGRQGRRDRRVRARHGHAPGVGLGAEPDREAARPGRDPDR